MDTDEEAMMEIEEEPWRRIEISILDEDGDTVFELWGNVERKTAHRFLESVGYAFIPVEPIPPPRAAFGQPIAMGKISCEHGRDCTDYPKKCSECDNNKAKSYFKSKEE